MKPLPDKFKQDHIEKVLILVGLIEQLNTMVSVLYDERQKNDKLEKESETTQKSEGLTLTVSVPFINTTHETALKASVIFFQFSVIEAIVNLLSDLTIQINESTFFDPKNKLTQAEVDFLTEKSTFFNPDNKREKAKQSFKKLEDKIDTIPFLLAKSMGVEFKLDKGEGHWEKFLTIKKKRDLITHPKNERVHITDEDIFNGAGVIYWLSDKYFLLIRDLIYPNDNEPYQYIERSSSRLLKMAFHATSKQFSLKPYIEKQTALRNK